MWIIVVCVIGYFAGLILFRTNFLPAGRESKIGNEKVSIIIPARNEEYNLPYLLQSLQYQTVHPIETIVIDDCSEDGTKEIALQYGVKLIENEPLPSGWTGKIWAVWNGYKHAQGDVIVFFDADVRLKPHALESLLEARRKSGGAISVVPFHYTEKSYERLALVTNILSVFAFMSPFERNSAHKGFYGSCIVTTRSDYERIGGHESIRSEVLDDISLGEKYREAGIPVINFLGGHSVSFRMYPSGIRSEFEGFSKSAVQGAAKLSLFTTLLVVLWVVGLALSEGALFLWNTSLAYPLLAGYALYFAQIVYLGKYTGKFGWFMPLAHVLSFLFFLCIIINSAYQVIFLKQVAWKGRKVRVGGKSDQ